MATSNMMSDVPGEEEHFHSEISEGSPWTRGRKASEVSHSLWHGEGRKGLKLSQLLSDAKEEKIAWGNSLKGKG